MTTTTYYFDDLQHFSDHLLIKLIRCEQWNIWSMFPFVYYPVNVTAVLHIVEYSNMTIYTCWQYNKRKIEILAIHSGH